MAVFLVTWKCWRKKVLSCCQMETDPAGMDLNHFLAPPVKVIAKALYFANSETICSSMRSLKWSRWSWGSEFPLYALIARSLNPSGSFALRTSWLKGDPMAAAINSTSFSFMAEMARRKSSIRISPWPLGANTNYQFWAIDCWDHSWSRLLLSVSLKSALWPNLLKTFAEPILSSWLGQMLLDLTLASLEVRVWECVTSVLGLTPIC